LKNTKNTMTAPVETIINNETAFAVAESYKTIRTNIMYSMPKSKDGKVIVMTSSAAGDGKTTNVINLAITFAQIKERVLLIDCDLRKPKVHRYLKLDKRDGLSNVLCGFTDLSKAIKVGVRENLDVITAGETPPNPAELIQSYEFERLLAFLKTKYDYIFIDTPPVNVVTDASLAVKYSTGVVLLMRRNYTTYEMLDDAVENLKKVDANILGVVMIDSKEGNGVGSNYKYGKYKYAGYSAYDTSSGSDRK